MPMQVRLDLPGSMAADLGSFADRLRAATVAAVEAATDGLRGELAERTAETLGWRLARTIEGRVYHDPGRISGVVTLRWQRYDPRLGRKINYAAALTRGAVLTAQGREGRWLAIPTEAARRVAGARVSRRFLSPAEIEQALNKDLALVAPPGRPGVRLLVARSASDGRRAGTLVGSTPRRRAQGRQAIAPVVMFVLVRQVTLRFRFDPEAIARAWSQRLPDLIAASMSEA